jgi:hypothetical protein
VPRPLFEGCSMASIVVIWKRGICPKSVHSWSAGLMRGANQGHFPLR